MFGFVLYVCSCAKAVDERSLMCMYVWVSWETSRGLLRDLNMHTTKTSLVYLFGSLLCAC